MKPIDFTKAFETFQAKYGAIISLPIYFLICFIQSIRRVPHFPQPVQYVYYIPLPYSSLPQSHEEVLVELAPAKASS